MKMLSLILPLLLLHVNLTCLAFAGNQKADDCNGVGCFPKKSTIPHANLLDHCTNYYKFDTAVSVTPTSSVLIPIRSCLLCDMKLRTAQSNQTVTAIFSSLGLQPDTAGQCQRIRLDIYDGWTPSNDTLLSNKNGICGCNLPQQSFRSSNNTLTLRLSTSCSRRSIQFGTFDIIVAATEKVSYTCPGQFECGNGQCLNKNLVCDGVPQCPDHSDEKGCHRHHKPGVPTWLVVIFIIIAAALFVLFLVTMALVCLKYACHNGYTRV